MRSSLPLALIALSLTSACATSTTPSSQPTPAPMRPSACAQPCPALPTLPSPDEIATVIWTFELIDAAGQCRRLHAECRKAM